MKNQYKYIAHKLFDKNLDSVSTTIDYDNLHTVHIYAKENLARGVIYGPVGYFLMVEFVKRDHTSFAIRSNIIFKNSNIIEGIEFLKSKHIAIVDEQGLLDVIKNKRDVNEHLGYKR